MNLVLENKKIYKLLNAKYQTQTKERMEKQMLKLNATVGATSSRPHFEEMTLKKQKGITLIALIITIIVMLILVGVTINVALNGGLFTKASEASEQMQNEAEKEELLSAVVAALNNNREIPNVAAIKSNLQEGWTVTGNVGGPYTCISPYGNVFIVDNKGNIEPEDEIIIGAKEKVYRIEGGDMYIKTYTDNTAELGTSSGVMLEFPFEYVDVTEEVIDTVNASTSNSDNIPEDVNNYYPYALKCDLGDQNFFYLLLTNDEKILYYVGIPLVLEGETIEWATYGTQEQYYLLGTNAAYLVVDNNILYNLNFNKDKRLEEYYDKTYQVYSDIKNCTEVIVDLNGKPVFFIDQNLLRGLEEDDTKIIKKSEDVLYRISYIIDYTSVFEQIQ